MSTMAGRDWVDRFPTSTRVSDLAGGFGTDVARFIAALTKAGATVSISATYRPVERAYLMHWAYMIAKKGYEPARVPPMAGVDIDWCVTGHDGREDILASRRAAEAMVHAYGIRVEPALQSEHTQRTAIDMDIEWASALKITGADGKEISISSSPRNGQNKDLQAVGAGFGVKKRVSDPPHWSIDGD